jgi:hypothetical protein
MPPMTAHRTYRIVTHYKLLCSFTATHSTSSYCFLTIFQWPIRLSTWAFVTNNSPLLRLISKHYLADTRPRSTHETSQDKSRLWQCRIWSRCRIRPSSTGILAGHLWVPMAFQTIWSKKARNSLIVSRFPSRKELRRLQVTLRLTRLDMALSTSLHTRSLISSQRFWLNFWILRSTMVHYCLSWWVSVFRT